jgi:glycopeptide antibiotics resistance protein
MCVSVVGITLALGLWPFRSPANEVEWLSNSSGLRLGRPATVSGSNYLEHLPLPGNLDASIEVWLQPENMWDSGTFLSLYRPQGSSAFSFRQAQTDLDVQRESKDRRISEKAHFRVANVFSGGNPVFLTISAGSEGMLVYKDGRLIYRAAGFRLPSSSLADWIIVGDSPWRSNTWRGHFLGLAFYERRLSDRQVLSHFRLWTRPGQTDLLKTEGASALYTFGGHSGTVVHSETGSGRLEISRRYEVLDKIRFEPIWNEFEFTKSYARAAIKNLVGFVPLGWCFYVYWSQLRPIRRPVLSTIVMGAAVSFTIEFFQGFLPTRDSGTTDIITNTAGTALGIWLFRLAESWSAKMREPGPKS